MSDATPLTLTFRCPPELNGILPPPVPAVQGLPEWFKKLPAKAFNKVLQRDDQTVKRCPPFVDAMTYGFFILLPCDLKFEDGQFSWEFDVPPNSSGMRSPIAFHDESQVVGSPFHEADSFPIKFNNFWTVQAPAGYSLLFTHPLNRIDLPFTTVTGLVDSDLYSDNRIHFPAHWHNKAFNGVLPKGTPIAQCMPIKRAEWDLQVLSLTDDDTQRIRDVAQAIESEPDVYRHRFRAPKR